MIYPDFLKTPEQRQAEQVERTAKLAIQEQTRKQRQDVRKVAVLALATGHALVLIGIAIDGIINPWIAIGIWFVLMAAFGFWETR